LAFSRQLLRLTGRVTTRCCSPSATLELIAEQEGSGAPIAQSARELLDRLLDEEKGWTESGSD
jgi:hypothetical protein